jgi:hypothetical protein
VLGKWTAAAGETVVLSTYIVEHHVRNSDFKKCIAHQQGWATSTRFSRPLGHFGEILTYAVPYGLLGLAVFAAAGHIILGLALLAITLLDRVLLCLLVRSYIGTRRLRYRGDCYELLPQGRLRKLAE